MPIVVKVEVDQCQVVAAPVATAPGIAGIIAADITTDISIDVSAGSIVGYDVSGVTLTNSATAIVMCGIESEDIVRTPGRESAPDIVR